MSETLVLSQGLPSHIRPGLLVGGKYRLEAEIGKGSMGTVYRAVHETLGQRVAIKLISSEHLQSHEARHRFSVEAKAVAKLRSRHVVQVYDDGETADGNPYIVLEYLDGETLEQRLEREHDIPLADAVRVTGHVGRALARAHAQGIVHRDLKPANIFLVKTDDDELGWIAKVLDFGIAKLDSGEKGTTQAGTVLGTPLFMSPEQVRGASSVDHRADLYSLGMCLFHMLTGDYAFYSPNYGEILIGICTLPLPRLRENAPWLPESVEQWFQRACAKEPLERFQSADEMTEALAAAAGSATPLSKHKSFPEGRIAPETLVGYATPALATLYPRGAGARAELPASVAVGSSSVGGSSGSADWLPAARSQHRPLLIGVGLGLLGVLVVAITLGTLTRSQEADHERRPPPAGVSATAVAVGARPPAPASHETEATAAAGEAAPVSSVTAEALIRPALVTPTPKPPRRSPPARPSAPTKLSPSAAKSPSADLGF
jgi:serine/threonine protein kinase